MAAVRCSSYRNKEFRERKSDLGISVRKGYHYVRYYDRISQRDMPDSKERDGYNHSPRISNSSSGASGNDQKRRRVRLVEHDVDVGAQVSQKLKDGGLLSSSKKRKFSPIHDTKVPNFISPRIRNGIQGLFAVQPPQPLPHENIPPHSIKKTRQSEDCRPASDLKGLVDSPLDQGRSSEREPGEIEVEEDDNNLIRNITTSRWVSCDDEEVVLKSSSSTPSSHLTDTKDACECTTSSLFDSDREHEDVGLAGDDDYTLDTDSEAEDNELELPQRRINMLQGCRNVDEFEKVDKINEGTYGVVYRARDKKTGEIVALKKVKMEREREGFPLTSLREINILLSLQHSSIVSVNEVVVGLDSVFMVMEYMEHDLKGLMDTMKQPFTQSEVKCLMLQLLEGIDYLHDNWVLHRDLKTANLLMNNRGELKICDFGLSRRYSSPLRPYTQLVVSLWYRAPELLLGTKVYSTAIDMWSLGCIMAELLAKKPLFKGHNEIDQLKKIFEILGTPNELIWPGYSKLPGVKVNFVEQPHNKLRGKFPAITSYSGLPALSEAGFDLLNKLLMYDPKKRMTAKMALKHAWFHEVPLPKTKEFMPTFPSQIAQDRSLRRSMKSLDPVEKNCNKGSLAQTTSLVRHSDGFEWP